MFRNVTLFFFFFLLVVIGIAYHDHVSLSSLKQSDYDKFMTENRSTSARHALEIHPIKQMRYGVQKDFWIMQNNERNHYRIESRASELIIHQRKNRLEAVEKLQGITCFFQEIQPSGQLIRTIVADEGCYFYPSQHLVMQNATMHFSKESGRAIPTSLSQPFFSGAALTVDLMMNEKTPSFTARHLHASYDPLRNTLPE